MGGGYYTLDFNMVDNKEAIELLEFRGIPYRVRPSNSDLFVRLVVRDVFAFDLRDVYDIILKGGVSGSA